VGPDIIIGSSDVKASYQSWTSHSSQTVYNYLDEFQVLFSIEHNLHRINGYICGVVVKAIITGFAMKERTRHCGYYMLKSLMRLPSERCSLKQ